MSVRAIKTLVAVTAASVSLVASPLASRGLSAQSRVVDTVHSKEIFQELRRFRMMATVLHVGAHPDDENTQLITALSRGRAVRTAYLSVTRGDGGQNLLGPELGYKLGIARTQELLAARRVDGGRQFFTRALDFGFSKDYLEAFSVWGKDSILSDVVRVIRTFRPDVIVTVFSTVPGGTHGHHTGSAVLALDAFKIAADPKAFPDQVSSLGVWQAKRIFSGGRGGASGGAQMEIGGMDPVLNESFASISQRSRAMHKTQGFGQPGGGGGGGGGPAGGRGGAPAGTSRMQSFNLLAGDSAKADIFEGIDTTWSRVPGGVGIDKMLGAVMDKFDLTDPSKSVPALLDIRKVVYALNNNSRLVGEKKADLNRIIVECAALSVRTTVANSEVIPGESLALTSKFVVASGVPVTFVETQSVFGGIAKRSAVGTDTTRITWTATLPRQMFVTQPYWLEHEGTAGMFRVDDPAMIGLPENPPPMYALHTFEIGGQKIEIADEPVQEVNDPARGHVDRRIDVIAPASINFENEVGVFRPGATKDVAINVIANRDNSAGTIALRAPSGWTVVPVFRPVTASKSGSKATYQFTVTAPKTSTTGKIGAEVRIDGRAWTTSLSAIDYPHIPRQLLQPDAAFKAVSVDVVTRGKTVVYIPGAGDVAQAIEQMGYTVKQIAAKSITLDTLRGADAVVIGVRASNVNADLGAAMPALTAFAEAGGTVIEQYNQNGGLRNNVLGPYPFTIGGDRVTNENATVTILAPDHPVLNVPNKITPADFDGWVQERGIYFPNQWDARYTPIFAMNDAGEAPLNGSLLIAKVGKGYFAYTGLVFFRELPAGVPGAYRLFANLVSLGKPAVVVP